MIPALMIAFALLDLTFAGFRAAAGRSGRIDKARYFARAMGIGALVGTGVVGMMAALTWGAMQRSAAPWALFDELVRIGTPMAVVFGVYAGLVLIALGVYAVARHEMRTLATVAILGPFTLMRPWVVIAATAIGLYVGETAVARGLTALSSAAVLAAARLLDWHFEASSPRAHRGPLPAWQKALEIGRPLLLLVVFLFFTDRFGWFGAPFAVVVVFAFAILVHDLIHNALYLPSPWSRVVLSVFAQFLIKSGHALRTTHVLHHQRCLRGDDEEGHIVHLPVWRLVMTGPWLAAHQRWAAFRHGETTRVAQGIETLLNCVVLAALGFLAWRGSVAAAGYLGAVVIVTVTSPLWGAKIPHTLPGDHWAALWLKRHVGRFTPAACSVLFHELHHRSPRTPVALLAYYQAQISEQPPSPCEDPPTAAARDDHRAIAR